MFIFIGYHLSIIIIPVYKSDWNWCILNKLLYDWQTFNAGMIAILASLIALSTTAYKEEKQRERDLRAAKAFLPQSLSTLCRYCDVNIRQLHGTLVTIDGEHEVDITHFHEMELNDDVFNAFSECIRYAEPKDGDFLANIVGRFQVIRARLEKYTDPQRPEIDSHINIYSEILNIIETRKLMENSFNYARNEGPIEIKEFNRQEAISVLSFSCGIRPINYGLNEYINRS